MKSLIKIFYVYTIFFSFTHHTLMAQDNIFTLEQASELAINQDKEVLLVFLGSDWCKPCIQ